MSKLNAQSSQCCEWIEVASGRPDRRSASSMSSHSVILKPAMLVHQVVSPTRTSTQWLDRH